MCRVVTWFVVVDGDVWFFVVASGCVCVCVVFCFVLFCLFGWLVGFVVVYKSLRCVCCFMHAM